MNPKTHEEPEIRHLTIAVFERKSGVTLDEIKVGVEKWMDEVDILGECTEAAILWSSDNGYSYDDEIYWQFWRV